MKLTAKQEAFVREYLIDLNATQAAIRAGYKKDYADRMGYKLVENSRVQKAIQKAMNERSNRTEITADRVLQELAHIAFDDIKNYLRFYPDEQGNIKMDIKDSETIDTRSISEVSLGKDGQFKFKMYCKDNALVQLGKHLGIFNDNINLRFNPAELSDEEIDEQIKKLNQNE